MQGKLTVNTVALWAWYWLHRGGMSYMVYGKMACNSCALYYCNDIHSHHGLYLCNLYPKHFCQDIICVHTKARRSKWRHPSCSCWPTCVVSQRAYVHVGHMARSLSFRNNHYQIRLTQPEMLLERTSYIAFQKEKKPFAVFYTASWDL